MGVSLDMSSLDAQDYISLSRSSLSAPLRKILDQITATSIDAPVTDVPSYEENPDNPPMPPGIKPVSPADSQPKEDTPKESAPKSTEDDDGDSPDLYDEVDVQASYPYGSKCPHCKAPTMNTERRIGPDAMESCKAGHRYRRGDAISIEDEVKAQYPHGTKCPACNAPTIHAELGFGPNVANECASGHQYEARHALAVRKPIREKQIADRIKDSSSKNPKYPNPEKGGPGSAPNPDLDTAPIDSNDVGKAPELSKMRWFLGGIGVETDDEGHAKWPLSFHKIEKDFKRPNKPGNKNQEPKAQDSQKPATEEKPYVI